MKRKTIKRAFLTLSVFLASVSSLNAQSLQEVVYLKNGSVIRGTIIEQIPNESLKVQTADGSVFVYKVSEVSKITKETPVQKAASNYQIEDEVEDVNSFGWSKAPRYRGFVGDSYVFGTGDYAEDREFLYTSHGVQINPFLYVGAGAGVNYWLDSECWSVPIFGHVRSELHRLFKKNVSPYLDAKIGYSVADVEGFYFAPSVGCHFYFGHSKTGLSVGVGYVAQNVKDFYRDGSSENVGGIEVTLALDF